MAPPIVVLLVEDDKDNRDMYALHLESQGFRTISAGDGAAGVALALEQRPDLIIMDLELPVMGGVAALARLKQDARTRAIPVIVVTGSEAEAHARATAAGCSAFLVKPCLPDDLEGVVRSLVAIRRLDANATEKQRAHSRTRGRPSLSAVVTSPKHRRGANSK